MLKRPRFLLLFPALLLLASTLAAADDFKVYGHRGMVQAYPENTMAAFAACVDAGISIELDVYLTKDGVPVVIHDATVDRTTNGTGSVDSLTLREIKELDAGSWYDPKFKSERVPTFGEALDMISRRDKDDDTFIAINMKKLGPRIEEKVVEVVERFGMVERVFAFGMDAGSTARFKITNAKFPVARSGNTKYHFETALRTMYLDLIWLTPTPPYLPSKEEFQTAKDRGKQVLIYVRQNEPERWKAARAAGADAICTDYPVEAMKALGL